MGQKQVPTYQTEIVEKVVEVPHVLIEEMAVEVPQIQTAEVLRQDAVAQTREVVKQIPRVSMQYRERVVELKEQIQQEMIVQPAPVYETIAPVVQTMPIQTLPAVQTIPMTTGYTGGVIGTSVPLTTGYTGGVIGTSTIPTYSGSRGYTSGVYGGTIV